FHRVAMALFYVRLSDLSDRLALRDVIADRYLESKKPPRGCRDRIDYAAACTDQNSFAGGTSGNLTDHSPHKRCGQGQTHHASQNPVRRFGNADEFVQLLR